MVSCTFCKSLFNQVRDKLDVSLLASSLHPPPPACSPSMEVETTGNWLLGYVWLPALCPWLVSLESWPWPQSYPDSDKPHSRKRKQHGHHPASMTLPMESLVCRQIMNILGDCGQEGWGSRSLFFKIALSHLHPAQPLYPLHLPRAPAYF